MKNKLTLLAWYVQTIKREHIQLVLVIAAMAMLALGVAAPDDGGGVNK